MNLTSCTQVLSARNSDSMVDIATEVCFLLAQDITDSPKSRTYPVVDFLVVVSQPNQHHSKLVAPYVIHLFSKIERQFLSDILGSFLLESSAFLLVGPCVHRLCWWLQQYQVSCKSWDI